MRASLVCGSTSCPYNWGTGEEGPRSRDPRKPARARRRPMAGRRRAAARSRLERAGAEVLRHRAGGRGGGGRAEERRVARVAVDEALEPGDALGADGRVGRVRREVVGAGELEVGLRRGGGDRVVERDRVL